jgi:hypothetical protein
MKDNNATAFTVMAVNPFIPEQPGPCSFSTIKKRRKEKNRSSQPYCNLITCDTCFSEPDSQAQVPRGTL